MEDKEFFDLLYQQWSKTTGAENKFWMPEEDGQAFGKPLFSIFAVDQDQSKTLVAKWMSEADADFISGVHGCIADLLRRLHTAIDEADRLDRERDDQEAEFFEQAVENDTLRKDLERMNQDLLHAESEVDRLKDILSGWDELPR